MSKTFELRRVMPEQVPLHWNTVEGLLRDTSGLWDQLWTLESIEHFLSNGGMQLWIAHIDDEHFLFFLSQIITYPNCRILRFFWASGNGIEEYLWALVETMNEVARELGCSHMEMEVGRRGWDREMRKYGVHLSRQILRREVMETRKQ